VRPNGVKLKHAQVEVSGLVQAPIGLDETALREYLVKCNVDVSKFGDGTTKTLKAFQPS